MLSGMKFKNLFVTIALMSNLVFANEDLIKTLDDEIGQMRQFLNFVKSEFKLSVRKDKDFNPKDENNFIVTHPVSQSELKKFFENAYVVTKIAYPYSIAYLDIRHYKLDALLGEDRKDPVIDIKEVKFLDGSKRQINQNDIITEQNIQKIAQDINESKFEELQNMLDASYFILNTPKPVDSLELQITQQVATEKFHKLKVGENFKIGEGEIKLVDIKQNEIIYHISQSLQKDENFKIYALYKDGRAMKEISRNQKTFYSKEELEYLEALLKNMQDAKKLVIEKKIKSKEEAQSYIDTQMKDFSQPKESGIMSVAEEFGADVSEVVLAQKVWDREYKFSVNYKTKLANKDEPYLVAQDLKSDKFGILGIVWKVEN
ncbi:hypothetical protein [Campylobacter sp. CCUG 57310]|uniref:hypothetical protein n=1 Tax=Campylobacter sp. CCUG 57310 TaxID=2517362 RepID=UPI001566BA04|nr:hypothetical protein [Campylobacter sp. CCUG 57310]